MRPRLRTNQPASNTNHADPNPNQYLNAGPLADAGAAAVCDEAGRALIGPLGEALEGILGDPERLSGMPTAP